MDSQIAGATQSGSIEHGIWTLANFLTHAELKNQPSKQSTTSDCEWGRQARTWCLTDDDTHYDRLFWCNTGVIAMPLYITL